MVAHIATRFEHLDFSRSHKLYPELSHQQEYTDGVILSIFITPKRDLQNMQYIAIAFWGMGEENSESKEMVH